MPRRSISARLTVLAALLLALAVLAFAATGLLRPQLPAAPILVDDRAGLMSAGQREFVAEYHRYLAHDHDIDYRIVTARDTGDINEFAARHFAAVGTGGNSRSARGLLLVVDPAQDRVRLEVGYGLEGVFPDAFVAYLEQRQMVPFFQADRVARGILAATELIVSRAQRAADGDGIDGEEWLRGSGGAGATAAARLGSGRPPTPASKSARGEARAAGGRPEATLHAYLAAMQTRDGDPGLDIYTPETRKMLQNWITTPAQMDNVAATYAGCHPEPARFDPEGRLAVIRYPPDERACAPWFFRRSDGVWRLDLTMMQRAIRFGRSNAWRLDPGVEHQYGFAFADWRFDRHGFPVAAR